MRPSFTRKFFSLLILWGSLLIAFFSVSYLTLIAAVPTATLWEFSIYLERMLGSSPLTGLESGQVANSTRLNNQPASYYQRLIWNCGAGYMLSVNADGTVVCGSPIAPPLPPPFTCAVRPAYTNVSFFDGTPAIANQPWDKIGPNCKYTCTGGYSGVDCSIPPVGNSCAASPACSSYSGCTLAPGTPTSIGQAWTQAGPNCRYTCNAGFTGPTCAPLGASMCLSYAETWSWSGQGGDCSATIPAGFSITDNQPVMTSPTITLANTIPGYSGSVTWRCIDSDPVVGTTAVEWTFAWGSCTAIPSCSTSLPACSGAWACTTTLGTPTTANQAWSRGASSCGFTCNPGYSGIDCEIAPSGWNCGTFSCFAHEQAWGWDVACWNNFKSALTAWTASGYITPAQRTQIEADGDVSWDATCGQLAAARATTGAFYRDSILNSPPVTGRFTLDTEERALFGGCNIDAAVACPALPPAAPTGLSGVAWNASVALSWTAPSGIIGDYIIEYKTTLGAFWLPFNDGPWIGTTANVTGLTNGVSFDFRVKARNGNGDSAWSNIVSKTPLSSDVCGSTNGIAQFSYPSWFWACTSGIQTDIDTSASDGTYNWNCGALSCSAWRLISASSTYPGCDTADIILPDGSTWALCNVWAITSNVNSTWSFGNLYQWWRNTPFPSNGFVSTIPWLVSEVVANASSSFVLGASSTYTTDWVTPQNDNLWWWVTNPMLWLFSSLSAGDKLLMQWPCSAGYHVPTYKEWNNALSSIDSNTTWAVFSNKTDTSIHTILKLPLSGFRDHRDGWQVSGSNMFGKYWVSSPYIVSRWNTVSINLDSISIWIDYNKRADAYSVRCIKDPVNSCAAAPACIGAGQCTQTANAPTAPNQAWSNGWAQCGYTCSGGWSGANCDVPPVATITWEYGCFVAGTQITLDTGKTKSIEDIAVGEIVRTYDEISKTFIDRPVTETFHHTERLQKLYTFEYGDQTLISNHIHRIYLPVNDIYISAEEIYKKWKNGEEIYFLNDQTHTPVKVHNIQVEDKVVPVYNLHVSGIHDRDDTLIDYTLPNHNYIANGVVVHNAKAPNTMAAGIAMFNVFNTNCTNAWHGILFQSICMADSTSIMASDGSIINWVVCTGTAAEQITINACRNGGGLTWVSKWWGCRNTTLYTITGDPQTEYENYEINPSCSIAWQSVLVGAADKYGFCPVGSRGAEAYKCE